MIRINFIAVHILWLLLSWRAWPELWCFIYSVILGRHIACIWHRCAKPLSDSEKYGHFSLFASYFMSSTMIAKIYLGVLHPASDPLCDGGKNLSRLPSILAGGGRDDERKMNARMLRVYSGYFFDDAARGHQRPNLPILMEFSGSCSETLMLC